MNDEHRYPTVDEEDGSCLMASEPAAAAYVQHGEEPDIDYNFGFHDFGFPCTLEEVKAEIADAEAHSDDPSHWVTSEQMWADIKQAFPWANIR